MELVPLCQEVKRWHGIWDFTREPESSFLNTKLKFKATCKYTQLIYRHFMKI